MKDLIIDTFNASKGQLNPNKRKNCFELLGYDFLIDEDFRLWVIEVNTNPYFGVPNVFIAELLPKMMDDLLELVVDPTYPPLIKQQSNLKLINIFFRNPTK
jgi:Tubulin-tyrosine ligase family